MRIISFGKTVHLLGSKSVTRRKWTTKYINEIQAMYDRGDRRLQSYDKFLAAQSIKHWNSECNNRIRVEIGPVCGDHGES